MIYDDIFKNKTHLPEKLLLFGFAFDKDRYVYSCKIVDNQFDLVVFVAPSGQVKTQILDAASGDEYTLHLAKDATGSFIGRVRAEYLNVLQTIADNCFEAKIFKSEYAAAVIQYIKEKYQHDLEYLWPKFPQNAIVRRTDNQKWYAALLTVAKNKIGLEGAEAIEIIDLRVSPEELEQIVDGKKYFLGYHMNKKHWLTICLDGSISLAELFQRIDNSFNLAA